jgi:hypothetical protein
MGTENDSEWSPKTREDWTGLFTDSFKSAMTAHRSETEEAEAKTAAENAAKGESDKPSSDTTTGESGSGDTRKRTFADRILGLK